MTRITTLIIRTSMLVATCFALAGCGGDKDDGGTPADAPPTAKDAAVDAPKTIDAWTPPPGSAATINCGMDICDRTAQVCCFTGPTPTITTECTAVASCMSPRVPGRCDGPEDCATGEECCGSMTGSTCVAPGTCTGTTASRLCHTAADCATGQICRTSMFVAFKICANN